jgi:5,6,7,8-tetrahydromethanopterin hydro-lyase
VSGVGRDPADLIDLGRYRVADPGSDVLRPNLPVKPMTLFVNKADVRGERHAALTWGPAQAGVAGGVADAVADDVIPAAEIDGLLLIAAVWVDWDAADEPRVYANNRVATRAALEAGAEGGRVIY